MGSRPARAPGSRLPPCPFCAAGRRQRAPAGNTGPAAESSVVAGASSARRGRRVHGLLDGEAAKAAYIGCAPAGCDPPPTPSRAPKRNARNTSAAAAGLLWERKAPGQYHQRPRPADGAREAAPAPPWAGPGCRSPCGSPGGVAPAATIECCNDGSTLRDRLRPAQRRGVRGGRFMAKPLRLSRCRRACVGGGPVQRGQWSRPALPRGAQRRSSADLGAAACMSPGFEAHGRMDREGQCSREVHRLRHRPLDGMRRLP
jgi:hypothetical protein